MTPSSALHFSDLLAREDESLLVGRDSFLLLDGLFDLLDAARSTNLHGHSLACEAAGTDEQTPWQALGGSDSESEPLRARQDRRLARQQHTPNRAAAVSFPFPLTRQCLDEQSHQKATQTHTRHGGRSEARELNDGKAAVGSAAGTAGTGGAAGVSKRFRSGGVR